MSRKYRVLILGIGQSNFLDQLYGKIKDMDEDDSFKFAINSYDDFSKGITENPNKPYKEYFKFELRNLNRKEFRNTIIKLVFQKIFWTTIYFGIKENLSFKGLKNSIGNLIKVKHFVEQTIVPLQFDVVHVHFCIPEYLLPIYFLKNRVKTICSFWGSDLLRINDSKDIFYQKFFLNKAELITVQTPEMARISYEKISKSLKSKTRCLKFTLSQDIFDNIDRFREDKEMLKKFKEKIGMPSNKIIVSIGHNGFPENNHLKIIDELSKLKDHQLQNFYFFIHASYGANTEYIEKLKEIGFLNIKLITDFFGPIEMAKLRLITDLLIQMPTTDALSAAMTEVLYSDNSVVSASWLPYEEFKRKGVFHFEVNTFADLPQFLNEFRRNKHRQYLQTNNPEKIKQFFFPDVTTPEWIKLYKDILN
jgi:hypothetical protein